MKNIEYKHLPILSRFTNRLKKAWRILFPVKSSKVLFSLEDILRKENARFVRQILAEEREKMENELKNITFETSFDDLPLSRLSPKSKLKVRQMLEEDLSEIRTSGLGRPIIDLSVVEH